MRSHMHRIAAVLAGLLFGVSASAAPVPAPNAKYEQPTIVMQA